MDNWTPITFDELLDKIGDGEKIMAGDLSNFWHLIKTTPTKWTEKQFGGAGGGFWVVAICEQQVIWYNDIEEGFNISLYSKFVIIDEYWCNQDNLQDTVQLLFNQIKVDGQLSGHSSSPIK